MFALQTFFKIHFRGQEVIRMATMVIRHKVEDYASGERGYDDADWLRKQHGITYASVHREAINPNDIIVVHQFKDMKGARDFAKVVTPLMGEIGVMGSPEIWFSEDVERVAYS